MPLTGPQPLTPLIILKTKPASPVRWLTEIYTTDLTIFTGISSSILIIFLVSLSIAQKNCRCCTNRYDKLLEAAFRKFDKFPLVNDIEENQSPVHRTRQLGGAFTLIGGIVFATLALILILTREADNISISKAVMLLTAADLVSVGALPFATANSWGSGLQIRITSSGDITSGNIALCASPLGYTSVGLDVNGGNWSLSTSECAISGVNQIVFACPACLLTPATVLTVFMHYSCQSLLIEAGALDANKTVSALVLPVAETVGNSDRSLSTITWSLTPLTSVLVSSVPDVSSARGYALVETTHVNTTTKLVLVDDGVGVSPNAASVVLTFALPLSNFYTRADLTEKQSITALLTSIVGLAGVFGFFGTLLGWFDSTSTCVKYCCFGGRKAELLVRKQNETNNKNKGHDDADDDRFDVKNPLRGNKTTRSSSVPSTSKYKEMKSGGTSASEQVAVNFNDGHSNGNRVVTTTGADIRHSEGGRPIDNSDVNSVHTTDSTHDPVPHPFMAQNDSNVMVDNSNAEKLPYYVERLATLAPRDYDDITSLPPPRDPFVYAPTLSDIEISSTDLRENTFASRVKPMPLPSQSHNAARRRGLY